MKVLIVSGISGSGKSTFLKALEDTGYFCVDNFPLVLLHKFLELCELTGGKITKSAFVIDIREREFFKEGKGILRGIKERFGAELVFLESSDDTLLKRFSETRRSHPLYDTSNVKDALIEERTLVNWIRDMADKVIDTSHLTPHELRHFALKAFGHDDKRMKTNLISFGYSYGIPLEADLVLDVRFLPNPFFIEGLRDHTGLSPDVRSYIKSFDVYTGYSKLLLEFLGYLIPLFEKEGKSYLTIAFGCTGGKHRSVFIVRELEEQLPFMGCDVNVSVVHRDIDR
jgi:RNase adapter protein RapZ